MKKLVYLISLVGIVALFSACSAGYVSVVPVYEDVYIPARPGGSYIWIEGNWYWNNRTRSYRRSDGHWTLPRQGRNYEPGRWNKSRRGYRWEPGRWR